MLEKVPVGWGVVCHCRALAYVGLLVFVLVFHLASRTMSQCVKVFPIVALHILVTIWCITEGGEFHDPASLRHEGKMGGGAFTTLRHTAS